MPVLRKRGVQGDNKNINGLYIHSNPPRVLQLSSAHVKQLIRGGDVDKLEQAVLDGQGRKLVGEYSADYKTRTFLKSVPILMSKISLLHDAVNSGRLEELQHLLEDEPEKKKKLVLAKDESGVGLLHKAIYYDLKDIYKWLIEKFPQAVSMRDSEGRTPYHYTPICQDTVAVQKLLTRAGADPSVVDLHQHSTKYYMDHKQDLELPNNQKSTTVSRKSTANKDGGTMSFKKSNIRIWIHQRNVANLQQVVWEGHGGKLLVEHSNNPKIKKFLEAVPHIMGLIKEIHVDVQNGDLEGLKSHVAPPIPAVVLSSKDSNGLTPLHKAVGLDKMDIVEFILNEYPECINAVDNESRTPLHYAALLKDDGKMTKYLIDNGADESALDNKQKTAAYYKSRNSELDAKLLNVVPECPRSAKESFAANFDWSLLSSQGGHVNGLRRAEKLLSTAIENRLDNIHHDQEENGNKEEAQEETDKNDQEEKDENAAGDEETTNDDRHNGNEEVADKADDEETSPAKSVPNSPSKSPVKSRAASRADSEREAPSTAQATSRPESQANGTTPSSPNKSRPVSQAEPTEAEAEKEEEQPPLSKSASPVKSRPDSQAANVNKSRPESELGSTVSPTKSRPESKAEQVNNKSPSPTKSRTPSPTKSRPASQAHTNPNSPSKSPVKTRPSSEAEKSRPTSINKTASNTRPGSKADGDHPDENHIDDGSGPIEDGERVIEGVVHGEHEIESMDNEGQNEKRSSSSAEIKEMVQAGNMEHLAALVLNGEGEKLIGETSENPELQSFLDNVPIYMAKIKRIHEAARNGSLRDLQAALDRRKFAIARDSISPKGASPLHVAIAFGNTSIVRYLAGRFPETVQVTDDDGRTPLHYAAVLSDNGHYYNLLVHLGADTRTEDKLGHTPEYYRKHQAEFSHKAILKDFGAAEDAAEEILTDKDKPSGENGQVDMPFFATEEGRYLASSLGDPLIKGLTEVANKRPDDPIAYLAQYLYNFANLRQSRGRTQENAHIITGSPTDADNNNAVPANIDVVTVEPNESDEDDSAFNNTSRDEHGQSMLHFAAARAHGRNALFQLMLETEINVAYRDELYRTARDISIQANLSHNTEEIDRYVLHIATKGDTDKLVELLLDGYDHITDIVDDDDVPIVEAVSKADQPDTVSFLQSILAFEEKRERVHHAIRQGSINDVTSLLADENDTGSGKLLAIGKNSYGRCTLHIAVLCQQEEIVDFLANTFPDTLKLGDNLERTALHYSMGVEKMETISRVLIKAGAKRVTKDLKGRQPTYYFLNKSDIIRLQEEEETF